MKCSVEDRETLKLTKGKQISHTVTQTQTYGPTRCKSQSIVWGAGQGGGWTVVVRRTYCSFSMPQTTDLDLEFQRYFFHLVSRQAGDLAWHISVRSELDEWMNAQLPAEQDLLRWGAWSSGLQSGPCHRALPQSCEKVSNGLLTWRHLMKKQHVQRERWLSESAFI